jgi:hypothetical protein
MRDTSLPPARMRKAATLGAPFVLRPVVTLLAVVAVAVLFSVWR